MIQRPGSDYEIQIEIGPARMHWPLLQLRIVIFCCMGAILPSFAQEVLPAIIKKIQPSIVVILTYDIDKKPLAQGSGFFVSKDGDVITNRHVLLGAKSAEVKTEGGKTYAVEQVYAEDKNGDLARIKIAIPQSGVSTLQVISAVPEIGQRIFVIGSPLGLEQTVTDGIVSAIRQIPSFGNIIQISAPISPGSSGSPVVNLRGEVIGIATFQMVEGQNLNFAIPGQRVLDMTSKSGKPIAEWNIENARLSYEEGKNLLRREDFVIAPKYGISTSDEYGILTSDEVESIEKALGLFKRAIAADPLFLEAYAAIGWCYSGLHFWEKAAEVLEQAICIKSDDVDLYLSLASVCYLFHRYEEAIKATSRAIQIRPNEARAYFQQGQAYHAMRGEGIQDYKQQRKKAIDLYWQAIRIKPDYVDAYEKLGSAYTYLELFPLAIEAYKQGIRYDQENSDMHYLLGMLYVKQGDFKSAQNEVIVLQDLATRLPPEKTKKYMVIALAALLKEYIEGIKRLREDEIEIIKRLRKYETTQPTR